LRSSEPTNVTELTSLRATLSDDGFAKALEIELPSAVRIILLAPFDLWRLAFPSQRASSWSSHESSCCNVKIRVALSRHKRFSKADADDRS